MSSNIIAKCVFSAIIKRNCIVSFVWNFRILIGSLHAVLINSFCSFSKAHEPRFLPYVYDSFSRFSLDLIFYYIFTLLPHAHRIFHLVWFNAIFTMFSAHEFIWKCTRTHPPNKISTNISALQIIAILTFNSWTLIRIYCSQKTELGMHLYISEKKETVELQWARKREKSIWRLLFCTSVHSK